MTSHPSQYLATRHRIAHVLSAFALVLSAALLPVTVQAQSEAVSTKRTTELRDGPSDNARSLSSLPAQTALTRQAERSGPWMQVRTSTGAVGWVHMFDIGNANTASTGGGMASGFLRGVTGLFNKGGAQQNTTVATSTVGIRGLDSQDLANAQPDINRVNQMEGNRVDASNAQQFAATSGLERREVPALEAPGLFGGSIGGSSATPANSFGKEAP